MFAIGETVSLKSGSLGMTVEWVNDENAGCVWSDKQGKINRDTFPKDCLRTGVDDPSITKIIIEGGLPEDEVTEGASNA